MEIYSHTKKTTVEKVYWNLRGEMRNVVHLLSWGGGGGAGVGGGSGKIVTWLG